MDGDVVYIGTILSGLNKVIRDRPIPTHMTKNTHIGPIFVKIYETSDLVAVFDPILVHEHEFWKECPHFNNCVFPYCRQVQGAIVDIDRINWTNSFIWTTRTGLTCPLPASQITPLYIQDVKCVGLLAVLYCLAPSSTAGGSGGQTTWTPNEPDPLNDPA